MTEPATHPTHRAGKPYACLYPDGVPDGVAVTYASEGCRGCQLLMVARGRHRPDVLIQAETLQGAARLGVPLGEIVPLGQVADLVWEELKAAGAPT